MENSQILAIPNINSEILLPVNYLDKLKIHEKEMTNHKNSLEGGKKWGRIIN